MATVPQEVLQVLDRAQVDGSAVVLTGQLDRKLYTDVNKVLEAAGGKWNRKAKAHLFDGPAMDTLEPIILTGEYTRTKQDFGQFDSPPAVVARLMDLAEIEPGMTVLEPSAGIGNIAKAAASAGGIVTAIEIDAKRAAHLAGIPNTTGHNHDFFQSSPSRHFDRVVMNPPFAKQDDIRHVMHAANALKPGGRLVSVMSAGVMFRENALTREFREFIADRGGSFERLPDNSFADSGTQVNACIVSFAAA